MGVVVDTINGGGLKWLIAEERTDVPVLLAGSIIGAIVPCPLSSIDGFYGW